MRTLTDRPTAPWPAPTADGPLDAVVVVPGSKSGTNRALVLAALGDGQSRLRRPLRSRDTLLMAAALRELGASVVDDLETTAGDGTAGDPVIGDATDVDWLVQGGTDRQARPGATVDCGNAGTVARFTPALATLTTGDVRYDGDARMRDRPLTPLLGALRTLGAQIDGDRMPFVVHGRGRMPGGTVVVDASSSSQLVSGLLLAAPRFDDGVVVTHRGARLPSLPYLDMTVADLRAAGALVDVEGDVEGDTDGSGRGRSSGRGDGGVSRTSRRWSVAPGGLKARDLTIEPDMNSAAAFLAAAAVTGGRVLLRGWPAVTEQPGRMLPELLTAMGCGCTLSDAGLEVRGGGSINGIDVDLTDFGEAAPTLTALAVLANSPSRLRGIAHLRLQETDRLEALASELGRLGADVRVTSDGLDIRPVPLRGARLDPRADHRLAMAYAVVGLAVPGVTVDDVATTAKTVPDFPSRWAAMLRG